MSALRELFTSVVDDKFMVYHSLSIKGSHKWYWVVLVGRKVVKMYGRLPGYGIEPNFLATNKTYNSHRLAEREFDKTRDGKRGKGYVPSKTVPTEIYSFAVNQMRAVTNEVPPSSKVSAEGEDLDLSQFSSRIVEV